MSHMSNKLDPRMQNVHMNNLKRPPTGYLYFCRQIRSQLKQAGTDLTTKELMGHIANQWSKLTPDQKARYDLQAGDDRAQFNQQFSDFRRKMDIDEENGDDT